jgi:hypothetical protein
MGTYNTAAISGGTLSGGSITGGTLTGGSYTNAGAAVTSGFTLGPGRRISLYG